MVLRRYLCMGTCTLRVKARQLQFIDPELPNLFDVAGFEIHERYVLRNQKSQILGTWIRRRLTGRLGRRSCVQS